MIMMIVATALIQCVVRTHAGCMVVGFAATERSSLAARLDIFRILGVPCGISIPIMRQAWPVRYCNKGYEIDARGAWRSQKSEPGCPGSRFAAPVGKQDRGRLRRHQDGVDHVDDAVRLIDVRNRHDRGI